MRLLFFVLILSYVAYCSHARWCINYERVLQTKWVERTYVITVPKYHWWFNAPTTQTQVKVYRGPESYYVNKPVRSCCEGYRLTTFGNACEPICYPTCDENEFCFEPNECRCETGFERLSIQGACRPVCNVGCPAFSTCVAPGICDCENGYTMNEDSTQCEPICEAKCPPHSVCYKPNECLCEDNYQMQTKDSQNYCDPICEPDCGPNGKCVAPNSCECDKGYEIENNPKFQCQPKCNDGCINGLCFLPDSCICNPGYVKNASNICAPTCSLDCVNGVCVEPEVCKCNDGYRFTNGSVHICEPICEVECVNADCAAPNTCLCREGYEPIVTDIESISNSTECKPSCRSNCTHGTCVAPDTCSCNEGYALHISRPNDCVPICNSCTYGDCVSPGECKCWPGYRTSEDNICVVEVSTLTSTFSVDTEDTDTEETTASVATTTSKDNEEVCYAQCKCWQKSGEVNSLFNVKCEHICLDAEDYPCLNSSRCYCDHEKMQLICNCTTEYDGCDTDITIYDCEVKVNLTPTSAPTEMKAVLPRTRSETQKGIPSWLIWTSLAFIGVASSCIVLYLWRRYKGPSPDNFSVGFAVQD